MLYALVSGCGGSGRHLPGGSNADAYPMSPSRNRVLRVAGVVVALALVGLAFYPGTFATPYADDYEYRHQIVPDTAADYENTVEQAQVYQYSELSPVAQTFVDRTRSAPNDVYVPTVCQDWTLTCDAYRADELPEEFTYGDELRTEEANVVIADGEERFLLQTGMVGHGWFYLPFRLLSAWLALLPLAVIVGRAAHWGMDDRALSLRVGGGAAVGCLAFAAPYVEMAGSVSGTAIGLWTAGAVWLGLLAIGGRWVVRRVGGTPA